MDERMHPLKLATSALALALALHLGCGKPEPSDSSAASALTEETPDAGPLRTCPLDVPNPSAVPGADAVYFTMPDIAASEVDCRTLATGKTPAVGRLNLGIWQIGIHGADTRVTWPVGDTTGFSAGAATELPTWQRGPNDELWSSAIQMRGRTIGVWLNSGSTDVPMTGEILPGVAHFDLPASAVPKPFAVPNVELSMAVEIQIPTAKRWGSGVPYAAAVYRFADQRPGNEARLVWFSMVVYDPRGAPPDNVMIDGCSTCSGAPILMSAAVPGRGFLALAPGSAQFSDTPWSGFRRFDFRVGAEQLGAALAAAKEKFGLDDHQLSPDPADYGLIHINLNPEVFAPAGGGGAIGFSARGLTVARYPRPGSRQGAGPIERVIVNAANASAAPELQVFFKTQAENFYDERKSIRVPFPTGGGNSTVVGDLSRHPAWTGTLTGLRIDPFDSHSEAACFNVDYVGLTDAAGNEVQRWDFDGAPGTPAEPFFGWRFSGLERTWTDGRYWGACQSDGDPYFYTDLSLALGR
jgi:hypothetical protein